MLALDSLLDVWDIGIVDCRLQQGLLVALKITREMLVATYDLLRTTSPFRGWHLPSPETMKFQVTKHKDRSADWNFDGKHCIRVSQIRHETLPTLLMSVAHEMCHIKEHMNGARWDVEHGASFKRLADRVCKTHGFDRGQF